MLVIDGKLHPRFLTDSSSATFATASASRRGSVVLAISEEPVTFHEFARLFRDVLDAAGALPRRSVSRLWAPGIGRRDFGRPLGPILGVVRAG